MNAKVNNNEMRANEANTTNNQLAFERFCEFSQKGYSICVELKSKIREKACFWITATKENEETEEICLFLNQGILNLVMNYLESGKLGDTSKINPNDLESFNERVTEFKKELFQTERRKGKEIAWSYNILEKLASIHYKQGVIIFHPYAWNKIENTPSKKAEQKDNSITEAPQEEGVITPDSDSHCSPHTLPSLDTFATAKREECLLAKKYFINPLKQKKWKQKKLSKAETLKLKRLIKK